MNIQSVRPRTNAQTINFKGFLKKGELEEDYVSGEQQAYGRHHEYFPFLDESQDKVDEVVKANENDYSRPYGYGGFYSETDYCKVGDRLDITLKDVEHYEKCSKNNSFLSTTEKMLKDKIEPLMKTMKLIK